MPSMDLVRFGRGIRALRLRRRWRQHDVGRAAGVSRSVIARIEVGLGDRLPLHKLDKVANALGARTDLRLSWNGEGLDRLLDAAHAELESHSNPIRSKMRYQNFWLPPDASVHQGQQRQGRPRGSQTTTLSLWR